jgi:hypothetical protein
MKITEKTINNVSVKPIVNNFKLEEAKVKGASIVGGNPYHVTFLCAKRKSGKTNCLAEMIKRTTDKRTIFWIFCPTSKVDPTWISIIEYLENRGNQVNVFDSIMEGRVNLLDEIMSDLSSPEEDKDKKKEDKPIVPLSNPIAMYYKDGELNPPLEMTDGASQN